jgi:hypothetical protein
MAEERRRTAERRRLQERRAQLTAIQATHDDLRSTIEKTAAEIEYLKSEQNLQLIRIAQIQREIDDLKRTRR